MKKLTLLTAALTTFLYSTAFSQSSLPQPSPAASVSQTFGITNIQINYHCPGVKGRTVWDSLVPYNKVWRTGANEATTITFSTSVTIDGKTLGAGKYALFTIPNKDSWTVIIDSTADQWGAYRYNKAKDAIRFTVTPKSADFRERMAFFIDDINDSTAIVTFHWEKLKFSFKVMAKTISMVQQGIDNNWRNLANMASYYVDNKLDLNKAQNWANASIALDNNNFYNRYVLARVLKARGDTKEALKSAEESKKIGDMLSKDDNFYNEYKDEVAKLVTELGGGAKK
jgi:hypothetical protein